MEKIKSVKKNFFYNFSLNIVNMLFPLITIPYVFQKLGAENLGKYNFAISFSQWFLVLAAFGTATYGVREIAKYRDDQKKLDKTFTEIFILNFIATIISFLVFLIIIFLSPKTNSEIELFIVVSLSILLNIFCIDWFYMGLENFKLITIRTLIIKTLSLIGIFLLIDEKNDYVIYAFIMVIAIGLSNIVNFIYSFKFVRLRIKETQIKNHLRPSAIFFFSSVIVSIYTIFDYVLLGFFSTHSDVAFYTITKQLYYIALSVTLSVSTVLLPKLTNLAENDFKTYEILLKKSLDYIYLFSIPAMVGLIVLSTDLLWLIGGVELQAASISLVILAILVFVVSLGSWQYNQLLIPLGHEKMGLKVQLLMALISLTFNLILIPIYGYIGASISLVIAEGIGTIIGIIYMKKVLVSVKVNYITNSLPKYFLASLIMALTVLGVRLMNLGSFFNLMIGLIIGTMIYFTILYILNESICKQHINYAIYKLKDNRVKKELN